MPIELPVLDNRRYQDLRDEALGRIAIHNPEWTNFNRSDPGVTLVELFAFLTETLLYRANQIPERNRLKFLTLLGVPLQTASAARGIVTFRNERGPLRAITLPADVELRAGELPFRTESALDVLPIEALPFYKRALTAAEQTPKLVDYYTRLYSSYMDAPPALAPLLYETTPLAAAGAGGLNLGATVDGSLWIALLARPGDRPFDDATRAAVRDAIGGKVLSLGIVPALAAGTRTLRPVQSAAPGSGSLLRYEIPSLPPEGKLPTTPALRKPSYAALDERSTVDVLAEPGIVQLMLPPAPALGLWTNLDPLEPGVGDFPPALEDSLLEERLLTWVRIRSTAALEANLLWVGINAMSATQRARVVNEALPDGTGEPDQEATLSRPPILPGSVTLRVTPPAGATERWSAVDDLSVAGPEVPAPDVRAPPGQSAPPAANAAVFRLDAEAGRITFGDGAHGRRPPARAIVRADYDSCAGALGLVGVDAINSGPALPAGIQVTNPVRTWGGAAAETVAQGEQQIAAFLHHRDRLVSVADFETITRRTPGVEIGHVEVLPAYHPDLGSSEPGDAAGAVTLLLIPRSDPAQPDAPLPDSLFLDAVCRWLEPRRLVTTELVLCGPTYVPLYLSVGIEVVAGYSVAAVREAVKVALQRFLSPLPPAETLAPLPGALALGAPLETIAATTARGWPLRKPVVELELLAEVSRVAGVAWVTRVLVGGASGAATARLELRGLELPRLLKVEVGIGEPLPLEALRGRPTPDAPPASFVPVPVIPEQCR